MVRACVPDLEAKILSSLPVVQNITAHNKGKHGTSLEMGREFLVIFA